jgi:transposase
MALALAVMIMGLALLVYSIAQKKLREALERENERIASGYKYGMDGNAWKEG